MLVVFVVSLLFLGFGSILVLAGAVNLGLVVSLIGLIGLIVAISVQTFNDATNNVSDD